MICSAYYHIVFNCQVSMMGWVGSGNNFRGFGWVGFQKTVWTRMGASNVATSGASAAVVAGLRLSLDANSIQSIVSECRC